MNSRTNLAYDDLMTAPYSSRMPYEQSGLRIHTSTKASEVTRKKTHSVKFSGIAIVAVFAFLVLCRGVMITDKSADLDRKRNELNALITSNEKLQVEIDRSLDLDKVEAIATTELGMRRAEKYQTVYVDLEQTDFVEKTAKGNFLFGNKSTHAETGIVSYAE